jgi:molybdate transport system ATP-binding protein
MLRVRVEKKRGDFLLNATFEAPTPGIVALFGRSGCGKTSIVQFIAGLLDADRGRIELDGTALADTDGRLHVPAHLRRVGYVFQDARLFPHLNVQGNLLYGYRRVPAAERRIAPDTVISLLGLSALLTRRPHQLSGGEMQRVALGRALLAQPRLLLMDEPLASLDLARRDEVLPYLEQLRDRLSIPIIYVSHQFEEIVRLASHIVLLEAGCVVASGGIEAVSLDPQLRNIVGSDLVGAVVEGEVLGRDAASGLVDVRIGGTTLCIESAATPGACVRVQLLARDLILALRPPEGLSVRNVLTGVIKQVVRDDTFNHLIYIDIGGHTLLSRVTHAAAGKCTCGRICKYMCWSRPCLCAGMSSAARRNESNRRAILHR